MEIAVGTTACVCCAEAVRISECLFLDILLLILLFYILPFCCCLAVGSGLHEGGSGPTVTLLPGDNVEVVEGELKGLEGKVITTGEDTITILPKHEDLKVHVHVLAHVYMYNVSLVYECTCTVR